MTQRSPTLFSVIVLFSWLIAPNSVTAVPPATTQAESAVSVSRLDKQLKRIIRKHKVPALAAAVIRYGKVTAVGVAGVRKARSKIPVTIDDQFHIGSCTKSMTATLCGILVDQRKLRWDMTLAEAMPTVAKEISPGFRDATLEQLLCHRSGLPDDHMPDFSTWPKILALTGDLQKQREEFIRISLGGEPAAQPGRA